MRQSTPQLVDVLTGSFTRRLFVSVFRGRELSLEEQAFTSWSLDGGLGDEVAISGSGTILYESVNGESMSPKGTKGALSAFRARLELVMEISAGNFKERVSLGLFRVVGNPTVRDYTADVGGSSVVVASAVEVSFLSIDEDVRRRGFRYPESPPSLDSCFDEIRRITGMPVEETVADQPIPASTVWEAKRGGRLAAVHALGDILGGIPRVNSVGAWEIVPDTVGDPVATLELGERGTVLDVGSEIDTDEVFNCIVGTFEDDTPQRNPIYAVAFVSEGDLAIGGDYGENTEYVTSDRVHTQADADEFVRARLDLVTGGQVYDVPIQCHINPLVELGDVLALAGWTNGLVGRLVKFSMSDSPYMNVTLRVHRAL